jgi:tryptophanyl-tRNA synthetase
MPYDPSQLIEVWVISNKKRIEKHLDEILSSFYGDGKNKSVPNQINQCTILVLSKFFLDDFRKAVNESYNNEKSWSECKKMLIQKISEMIDFSTIALEESNDD